MGTAERKEREKEQRRINIIDAAEKVFFSKGLEKATMDDVANEVELSKGTLYLYFKSKEELIEEIIKRGEQILANLFKEAVNTKDNGLCKVKNIGYAFMKFYSEHKDYHNFMLYGLSKFHSTTDKESCEECEKGKPESGEVFVKAIKEGIMDGSIKRDIDPRKTSLLLWGQSMGVLQLIQSQSNSLGHICETTAEELMAYFFEYTGNALRA